MVYQHLSESQNCRTNRLSGNIRLFVPIWTQSYCHWKKRKSQFPSKRKYLVYMDSEEREMGPNSNTSALIVIFAVPEFKIKLE